MLPMFDAKKAAGSIIARRGKPDAEVSIEIEAPGSEVDPALKDAATSILSAIERKSVLDLARALKEAHAACENYSDEDAEDLGDELGSEEGEE